MPDVTISVQRATIYTAAFPQKQRISVHGTSARVEIFDPPAEVIYRGWGTDIYGNHGEQVWVHFSIPVPLLTDDLPSTLSSIFFYFEANGARLTDVHVYDADIKFKEFSSINGGSGDFTRTLADHINRFKVSRTIKYSLGLSLRFQLDHLIGTGQGGEGAQEPAVTLVAAGAEYV